MNKIALARCLAFVSEQAAKKEKFDVDVFNTDYLSKDSSVQWLVELFANCALAKIVKGKITHKGAYLISRGKKLPYLEPTAIIEYEGHYPYDFCYVYRL